MKNVYLKPSVEIEELESQTIIATSGRIENGGDTNSSSVTEAGSKDRGTWGDIWN